MYSHDIHDITPQLFLGQQAHPPGTIFPPTLYQLTLFSVSQKRFTCWVHLSSSDGSCREDGEFYKAPEIRFIQP